MFQKNFIIAIFIGCSHIPSIAMEQQFEESQKVQIEEGEEEFQKGKILYEAARKETNQEEKQKFYRQAISFYEVAAQKDYCKAQHALGVMYDQGLGIKQSYEEAVKWYTLAAEQGDRGAQYNLGEMHFEGQGVEQSDQEAIKWLTLAANQGDHEAQCKLGTMYANGRGVAKSDERAVEWYTLAANQGNCDAQYNLGIRYEDGRGVEQSYEEAAKWYTLAANQGDCDAQYKLGTMYVNGRGVAKSDEKAVEWYILAAEQGDCDAQYYLGTMYEAGRGVNQSYEEAVKWYTLAANQGDCDAQYNLGIIYEDGRGVDQSYEEAIKWYTLSANQGFVNAQHYLGIIYAQGRGVKRSDLEAVKWYTLAANQGHAGAQCNLGLMYAQSPEVARSYEEAVKWLISAAKQRDVSAQYNLGIIYETGQGVVQSYEEAIVWYTLAAEQKYASAQYNLGVMYEAGQGVTQSDKEAVKWYTLAANQRHPNAQYRLSTKYASGKGIKQSYEDATKWLILSAEQGVVAAQYKLGLIYETGQEVGQSHEEAVKWYTLAANHGDLDAQRNLGRMYFNGKGVEQSDKETVKWYVLAANQGDAKAQYDLGVMYQNGFIVEQSAKEAVRWYVLAAEQGNQMAQYNLGVMYEHGQGIEQSDEEAVKWYTLAASQGDHDAQCNLGRMYFHGKGVEQSDKKAAKWYTLAANQGSAGAYYNLGTMYYEGRGVEQSDKEAVKQFILAANLRDIGDIGDQYRYNAQCNLGAMYEKGQGVKRSYKQSYLWSKKAFVKTNNNITSYNYSAQTLARLYLTGRATLKNTKRAIIVLQSLNRQTLDHDDIPWIEEIINFDENNLYPKEIKDEISLINFIYKFDEEHKGRKSLDFLLRFEDCPSHLGDIFLKYTNLSLEEELPSQIKLGILLEYGIGCPQDILKAQEWYGEAAQRRSEEAYFILADKYKEYNFENDNYARALFLCLKGARNLALIHTSNAEKQQSWFCQKHFLANNHGKLLVEKSNGSLMDETSLELIKDGISKIIEAEKFEREDNQIAQSKAFQIYLSEALKNNPYATYKVGLACNQGWHLQYDPSLLEWYEDLAKQGDVEAQYSLGNIYAQGIGAQQDKLKSFNFYRDAADQGHAEAQYALGAWLFTKNQTIPQALEWYGKSAAQGYPKACSALGELYEKGNNVNQDYYKAINYYKLGASYGDDESRDRLVRLARNKDCPTQAEAQAALGHLYVGIRIARPEDSNDEEVFCWLERASRRDDIEAQYRLARMYQYSWGTPKDEVKAFNLFKQAAESKWHGKSQKAMAEMYNLGAGVDSSEEEALRWYRRAAKQDDQGATDAIREMAYGCFDKAIYSVGKAYAYGWGIARDKQEAKKWYKKAIKVHHSPAKYALAGMLLKEIDKDKKAARAKLRTSGQPNFLKAKRNSSGTMQEKLLQAIDLLTEASGKEERRAYLVVRDGKYDFLELEDIPEEGYYKAQQKLADLYHQGLILPLNTYKNVFKAYTIAFHLHEKAFSSGGKHVDLGAFQRAQDKLNKLSSWEQDVVVGDQDEAFQKFIKVYGGIERFSPDFLCQVSYLLAQSKELDDQANAKISNLLQILTSLPQKNHQFTYFMGKLEEIVCSHKISELDDLFKDIDSSDCDLGWHWIHKPSQIPTNFKITQKALRDLSVEVFNSQFRELSLEAPDQSVFERAVNSIMQIFDHLQRKGLIKKGGLFDDEDQEYGDRNTLEKLFRHNPNAQFKNRIIRISDILNKEVKKDEVHTATQLMSWAIGGRHCSTRSEEETYLYYRSHILEAALEDTSLDQKKEKPLEFKIALCLAELREKLVEDIIPLGEQERIHKTLYLKKMVRKPLGLLGGSESSKDNLQWVAGDYQDLTEQDILSQVLTKYTPDHIADYLAEGINNARKGSVTFNQIRDRLRFQFLRDQIGPKGEFDKTLFEDEEFVLSPSCNREYVEKCVLLNQIGFDKKKDPEIEQKVMNWEALKGKSYEVANDRWQKEFCEDEVMGKFSRQGAKALLYGLGYLEKMQELG